MRPAVKGLLSFVAVLFLGGLILSLPPVYTRVYNVLDNAKVRVRAMIFPQQEVVFVPGGEVLATPTIEQASPSPTVTPTATPTPMSLTPQATYTPTPSPTPLPATVALQGVKWETQNGAWSYCGPTNLAMLLSYWGWKGDKFTTGKVLKPFQYDLNVMPYEMQSYVEDNTALKVKLRYGGTLDLLKKLLANGYPVLTEVGVYFAETATGIDSWMGHYRVVSGYNDTRKELIIQDSYIKADLGIPYDTFVSTWRDFDFVFMVVYPADKESQLSALLGGYDDQVNSYQIALKTASDEMWKLTGIDQYFAWYNRGTSLVMLQDFIGASEAYDKAFQLYAKLPEATRPWRTIWHETGPYYAYFYAGRYQDVADLATSTLDFIEKRAERLGITDKPQVGPFIEETWVWRARARLVLGDQKGAISDLKTALKYHPGFQAALDEFKKLGITP
jgi:tetratricopeptide (TPR) repeat protein